MIEKKIVFADCFDTVILRKEPANKVKHIWAQEMSGIYKEIDANKFYRSFLSAENKLKTINQFKFGVGEYDIYSIGKMIFNRFKMFKILNNIVEENDFINDVVNSYIKVEKSVILKNKKVVNMLENLIKKGSQIYIVSDFYCGQNIIKQLLKHINVEHLFHKVYVSCDYYKTKAKGNLYQFILEENNLKPEDVVMIGDNLNSDNLMPKSMGIESIKVKERNNQFSLKEKLFKVKVPVEFKHIFKSNKTNGFSNICFSLYAFTKRLVNKLQERNVSNVFFLSREGEFLKKLFDYYVERFNIKNIKSHYLQVSRNSILIAGLKDLEIENFETVIKETGKISISKFLTTLGFETSLMETICDEIEADNNLEYENFLHSEIFSKLKENKKFVEFYDKSRKEQHLAFSKYVNSFGVNFMEEGLNIVDVGWKGTMQDLLVYFFNNQVNINGYYLGYNGNGAESYNNIKFGLLYSSAPFVENIEDRIYKIDSLYFEQFLRATTNRVCGYELKNDNIEIKYDDKINDADFYLKHIKDFQDETFEKFKKLCDLVETKHYINIEKICLQMHIKMLKKISYSMFKFISNCVNSHYDSFARIGFAQNVNLSKKELVLYVLRKFKLRLKFLLNKV